MTNILQWKAHKFERVYCLALCTEWGTVLGPHGEMRCWLLLNRRYKPFGTGITEWVSYNGCPGTRLWLDEGQLLAIENGSQPYQPGADRHVWLYSDATNPNNSKALDAAYQRRVVVLAALMEPVA